MQHGAGYTHPYPSVGELGEPAGDPVQPIHKSLETVSLPGLTDIFDEDVAKAVLSLPFVDLVSVERLIKSLYDFDVDSPEGVTRLLGLLPVMDPEILKDIMQELWPGYVLEEANPELMRSEIRGYLMDYLDAYEQNAA